jgi:glutamate-5-semialdehyde dehydrogenase
MRLVDLGELVSGVGEKGVMIFADEQCFDLLAGNYDADLLQRAKPEHFGEEFLSLKMSVKVVADLDEALEHIAKYSSKHSEMVVSENGEVCERFLREVDAAAVYANASSAFTDGGQFGMGGEIGISTQKLHARGPMGVAELCSYKWIGYGSGQVR